MRIICILITAIIFTSGFLSCNKDKNNIDQDDVRVLAIEGAPGLSNKPSMRLSFDYDQLGRIESVFIEGDSIVLTKLYAIKYLSNEIIMLGHADTIQLMTDANGNVSRRIWAHHYQYQLGPGYLLFRYDIDTTFSEYNTEGLLVKETYTYWDTSWNNVDALKTDMSHYTANISYTNSGNDLTNVKHRSEMISFHHTPSGTDIYKRSWEYGNSFGYTKAYGNNTDFSNAGVLNQLTGFFWGLMPPLDKNYAHFPDQISWSSIERDENGNIVRSDNGTLSDEFTYDSNSFLLTRTDPNLPMGKVKFIYNR